LRHQTLDMVKLVAYSLQSTVTHSSKIIIPIRIVYEHEQQKRYGSFFLASWHTY
jgi:hypothetical protein